MRIGDGKPWYREIKRRIEAGEIGEVKNAVWIHSNNDGLLNPPYPNQPYFAQYPRFLIYETLVHFLDSASISSAARTPYALIPSASIRQSPARTPRRSACSGPTAAVAG